MWLVLALLALSASVHAGQKECDELGFTGDQLCSDCDVLAQYVKDTELVDDCKKCCTKDSGSKKYSKAELIMDQWRATSLPNIKEFIDKRAKGYAPQLKVTYVPGSSPKLRLTGSSGSETVRIDSWKAANIAEFLDERLDRRAAGGSTGAAVA